LRFLKSTEIAVKRALVVALLVILASCALTAHDPESSMRGPSMTSFFKAFRL
jgi:hypothetical protein